MPFAYMFYRNETFAKTCYIFSSVGSCRAGKCQNVKGSYWCNCPLGRAGRNCQHEDSVCQPNPCAAGEMCLSVSPTTGANYTCVAKKQGFSTMVKMTKERGWESFRKYDIEDDLNLALQNWKSKVCLMNYYHIGSKVNLSSILNTSATRYLSTIGTFLSHDI